MRGIGGGGDHSLAVALTAACLPVFQVKREGDPRLAAADMLFFSVPQFFFSFLLFCRSGFSCKLAVDSEPRPLNVGGGVSWCRSFAPMGDFFFFRSLFVLIPPEELTFERI